MIKLKNIYYFKNKMSTIDYLEKLNFKIINLEKDNKIQKRESLKLQSLLRRVYKQAYTDCLLGNDKLETSLIELKEEYYNRGFRACQNQLKNKIN